MEPRAFLQSLFAAAVEAAAPRNALPATLASLARETRGRVVAIGAGKASAAMAQAVEEFWPGDRSRLSGFCVVPYGHSVPCSTIEIAEAAHPIPDEAGVDAALRTLETVRGLEESDLVLALISGGGSALLTLPAPGLTLEHMRRINASLLKSGATIGEINCARKHLSAIKGGRLALACRPARLVSLLISDVPGDNPAIIASGLTVPDPTTRFQARRILEKYGVEEPEALRFLETEEAETPKPGDPGFERCETFIVASPRISLEAAAARAQEQGVAARILGDALEGEARELGRSHAKLARELAKGPRPCVLLSGGETTVVVRGQGKGGRNVEYLASLAEALDGEPRIYALAADTDGVDGMEEIAGAWIDPTTRRRALEANFPLDRVLADNDAHSLFQALGDSLVTGPTLTNVNDFRAILAL